MLAWQSAGKPTLEIHIGGMDSNVGTFNDYPAREYASSEAEAPDPGKPGEDIVWPYGKP